MKKGRSKKIHYFLGFSFLLLILFFSFSGTQSKIAKEVKGAAEEKKIYHALTIPNDPLYSSQWNFQKVSSESAWGVTTGSNSVTIAVLDTGVLTTHEDLADKIVPGYDFVGNDSDPNPDSGGGTAVYHGTIVSGVVAGSSNNSKGIASACWGCKIMPIRVLGNDGSGSSDTIASGIRYAADHGANIINMSFGYANSYGPDSYLTSAIDYAYGKGVVMIAAAGNDGLGVNYPAAYSKVLAVGASDQNDNTVSWSSYGPELDILAPGVSIPSSYTYWNGSSYVTNSYANATGTSIASPEIAGLAALLVSKSPSLTVDQVYSRIKTWADKLQAMNGAGFTNLHGFGRTNFYSSLEKNLVIATPQNGINISTSSSSFSGATEPNTAVNIYCDSSKLATINSDSYGGWSYQFSNLAFGTHFFEAEVTISGSTFRTGVTIIYSEIINKFNVYRFWNSNGTHFYTASDSERDNVIAKWPTIYKYEGVAYPVSQIAQNGTPLYRFYNLKNNTHFYTASEAEKNNIVQKWSSTYRLEGIAYNVSVNGGTPVYRFWNSNGTHFYTASESEKNNIIAKWPNIYKYEGVGYYIY